MKHRTQLYLDDDQYRWLRRQAGSDGSLAGVVRDLIDHARFERGSSGGDPFVDYLLNHEPGDGGRDTSVETLDEDLYSA